MSTYETPREGSAIRSFLLTALVIFSLFAAGAGFLLWKATHPHQGALTHPATVHLTKVDLYGTYKPTGTNRKSVDFTYSFDGHEYAGSVFSYEGDALWASIKPGQDLPACLDPADPTAVAPLFDRGQCGDEDLHVATAKARQVS